MLININGKEYETSFASKKYLRVPVTIGHTLVTKKDNTPYYNEELVNKTKHVLPVIEEHSDVIIYNKIKSTVHPYQKKQTPTFLSVHTNSYHHFLIDTIGSILYLKKNSINDFIIKTIIIPTGKYSIAQMIENKVQYKDIKNFHQEIFDYFKLGNYLDTILDLRKMDTITIDKTVSVNYPSAPLDSFYEIILLFKSYIPKDCTPNKKIYISRKSIKDGNTGREVVDEEILQKYFTDHGYSTVFFEDYSFDEQIKIMASASEVITYNGSSLVNTVFMQENTKILEIRNSVSQQHDAYMFWSKWFNIDHKILKCFGANTAKDIIDAIESDPEINL